MTMSIWAQPAWPCFSWDQGKVAKLLATARYEQGRLLGRMDMVDPLRRLDASRRIVAAEANASAVLETVKAPGDVVGILRAALQDFRAPLSPEAVQAMYHTLCPGNGWRDGAVASDGAITPPPPEKLEAEVSAFLTWFNASASKDDTDPIIKAAIAHLWWMTLQPGAQGNGIIARYLTCILLARADDTAERFYSISAQMLQERASYEVGLARTQKSSTDITVWLLWFLACFTRAVQAAPALLADIFKQHHQKQKSEIRRLSERRAAVIAHLSEAGGAITTTRWAQYAQCSQDTAYRDILDLISKNILRKEAHGGRSTRYSLIED
jgi:Fic family protein